jgi:ribosome-associated protein
MEYSLSRSEKKRRARNFEELAGELVTLSALEIKRLPCDDFMKNEILATRDLKAGARKRQIKFLTKNLRELDTTPLFAFLTEKKGSNLQQKKEFHELENLRDNIINDALAEYRNAMETNEELDRDWPSPALKSAAELLPDLDRDAVRASARRYTRTRKAALSKEIFRLLKAAAERKRWSIT